MAFDMNTVLKLETCEFRRVGGKLEIFPISRQTMWKFYRREYSQEYALLSESDVLKLRKWLNSSEPIKPQLTVEEAAVEITKQMKKGML